MVTIEFTFPCVMELPPIPSPPTPDQVVPFHLASPLACGAGAPLIQTAKFLLSMSPKAPTYTSPPDIAIDLAQPLIAPSGGFEPSFPKPDHFVPSHFATLSAV